VLDANNKRVIFIDGKDGKPADERDWTEDPEIEARKPEVPDEKGVNRFVWDLTHAGGEFIPKARIDTGNPAVGPHVSPGIYHQGHGRWPGRDRKVEVRIDPRYRTAARCGATAASRRSRSSREADAKTNGESTGSFERWGTGR
jgi:hypothetical protein